MTEFEETLQLAARILERPYANPGSVLSTLARQFTRAIERERAVVAAWDCWANAGGWYNEEYDALATALKRMENAVKAGGNEAAP